MKKIAALFLALLTVAALTVGVSAAVDKTKTDLIIFNVGDEEMVPLNFYSDPGSCDVTVSGDKLEVVKKAQICIFGVTSGMDTDVDLDAYSYFGVAYKASGMTSANMQLYYWTDIRDATGEERADIPLISDGKTHISVTDMSSNMFWTDRMHTLRCDLSSAEASGNLEVEYLVFGKTEKQVRSYMKSRTETDDVTVSDCILQGKDYIAFKMGYDCMITDYFNWDPANCNTSIVDRTWCVELTEAIGIADISNKMDMELDDYSYIGIRYRTEGMTNAAVQYYFWTDIRDADGAERMDMPLNCDGQWHADIFSTADNVYWTDHMKQLRVDVADSAAGGKVYIDYLLFAKDKAAAEKFISGGAAPSTGFSALPAAAAVLASMGGAALMIRKKHR